MAFGWQGLAIGHWGVRMALGVDVYEQQAK